MSGFVLVLWGRCALYRSRLSLAQRWLVGGGLVWDEWGWKGVICGASSYDYGTLRYVGAETRR